MLLDSRLMKSAGFSCEPHQPEQNVVHHTSLPRDLEFDHSRDEEDEAALRALRAPDDQQLLVSPCSHSYPHSHFPQNGAHGEVADVLQRHHQVNRHPSAPHPDRLAASGRNGLDEDGSGPRNPVDEVGQPASARSRAPRNSKKSKGQPASPDTLGYYPPIWKDFLEEAKRDCRVVHAINNPFPSKSRDLKVSVTESLVTSVVEWTDRGTTFESGEWLRSATISSLTHCHRLLARE
jgi:hypothetical protein